MEMDRLCEWWVERTGRRSTGLDWEKDQMGIDWTAATGDTGWWMWGGEYGELGVGLCGCGCGCATSVFRRIPLAGRVVLFSSLVDILITTEAAGKKESEDRERYRERGKSWQEDKG